MISALAGYALSPAGKAVGAFLAVGTIVGAVYAKGRSDGRASVTAALAEDRVKIFRDGKEIDAKVLGADDDGLCAFLGGCL